MDKLDYLIRAEKYAAARGDENWFKQYYTGYREYYGVEYSVCKEANSRFDVDRFFEALNV